MVAQQFDRVVVDRLLVRRGERGAAVAQRLDRFRRQPGLARLGFVGEPLELAIPEPADQQDDELAQPGGKLELKRSTRPSADHASARSGRCIAAASGPTGGERRGPCIIAS